MDGDAKGGDADERRRARRPERPIEAGRPPAAGPARAPRPPGKAARPPGRVAALPASVRSARRFRPALALALLASAAVHLAAFLLWRGVTPFDGERAAATSPSAEPTPGGGALAALRVALPRDRTIPPPPRPVLAVDAPRVELQDLPASAAAPDLARPAAGRLGPGTLGDGGPGAGSGSGDGDGFVSPVPRTVVPHWDPPASVRGMEVTVRIHVDARGRPTGEVKLEPPTPDHRFNREIVERVRRMEYRPARRNGIAVAGWAEITFVF